MGISPFAAMMSLRIPVVEGTSPFVTVTGSAGEIVFRLIGVSPSASGCVEYS